MLTCVYNKHLLHYAYSCFGVFLPISSPVTRISYFKILTLLLHTMINIYGVALNSSQLNIQHKLLMILDYSNLYHFPVLLQYHYYFLSIPFVVIILSFSLFKNFLSSSFINFLQHKLSCVNCSNLWRFTIWYHLHVLY